MAKPRLAAVAAVTTAPVSAPVSEPVSAPPGADVARVLPDLSRSDVRPFDLDEGVRVYTRGDRLVIECDMSQGRLDRAPASKSGALRIVAGGTQKWHKLDAVLGGMKLNLTLGVPNAAYDREAAKRARLIAEAKRLGLTLA